LVHSTAHSFAQQGAGFLFHRELLRERQREVGAADVELAVGPAPVEHVPGGPVVKAEADAPAVRLHLAHEYCRGLLRPALIQVAFRDLAGEVAGAAQDLGHVAGTEPV
jgi:hypothetical protein